jgi:hypothetical protein
MALTRQECTEKQKETLKKEAREIKQSNGKAKGGEAGGGGCARGGHEKLKTCFDSCELGSCHGADQAAQGRCGR